MAEDDAGEAPEVLAVGVGLAGVDVGGAAERETGVAAFFIMRGWEPLTAARVEWGVT